MHDGKHSKWNKILTSKKLEEFINKKTVDNIFEIKTK